MTFTNMRKFILDITQNMLKLSIKPSLSPSYDICKVCGAIMHREDKDHHNLQCCKRAVCVECFDNMKDNHTYDSCCWMCVTASHDIPRDIKIRLMEYKIAQRERRIEYGQVKVNRLHEKNMNDIQTVDELRHIDN